MSTRQVSPGWNSGTVAPSSTLRCSAERIQLPGLCELARRTSSCADSGCYSPLRREIMPGLV